MSNNPTSQQHSFLSLIETYSIEIPIIQRDYAQGRRNRKAAEIRTSFLDTISKTLIEGSTLELDFVYGDVKDNVFRPLDGQQRLTTLFLLHWYLANKENKIEEVKKLLSKFTYETRTSSSDFCKALVSSEVSIDSLTTTEQLNVADNALSAWIEDQAWFFLSWKKDPTIQSMLVMLDAIHKQFNKKEEEAIEVLPLFDRLSNITFHFVPLKNFGLSDDLYIKMNARGKPLTEFENFKAKFEQFLEPLFPETSKKFAIQIDTEWTNAFWKFSNNYLKQNPKGLSINTLCDNGIYAFIKKITEYLHFKNNNEEEFNFNFDIIEKIYSNKNNFEFLLLAFDSIYENGNYKILSNNYFIDILPATAHKDKVVLNFFNKLLKDENFTHYQNLLFFGWINFITKEKTTKPTDSLKDFLRIVSNYLNNFSQKQNLSLSSSLRNEEYHDILRAVDQIDTKNPYEQLDKNLIGFREQYIKREIDKYNIFKTDLEIKKLLFQFEDHNYLNGLTFNFDFKSFNAFEIKNIVENFYALFQLDDHQIIRLLLSIKDYSLHIKRSNLGTFRFLGKKVNWDRVLASPDGEIKENFLELFKLFSSYIITEWQEFINTQVEISQQKGLYDPTNWLRYLIDSRYFNNSACIQNHYIYTYHHDTGRVEIFGTMALRSYHYNPFVFWFRYQSPEETVRIYINGGPSVARHSNFSRLHLKNGIELEQIDNRWYICLIEPDSFTLEGLQKDEQRNCLYLECKNLIDDLIPYLRVLNEIKVA